MYYRRQGDIRYEIYIPIFSSKLNEYRGQKLFMRHFKTMTLISALNKSFVVWMRRNFVRFQVLTAASMKMAVFWVVAPCSLVKFRHFRGACYLHHQGVE
jgi:hypothetical protein